MPRIDPRIVPRRIAGAESIRSFLVGISPVIFCCTRSRSISAPASRLRMISAKPNTPIATVAKPRPSASSGILNAMREAPVSMSEPTIDSSSPNTIIAMALSTEPLASTTAKIRPSTISEKYSAGPNASATVAMVPMPGSTPTSVPTRAPIRHRRRLIGVKATPKPRARLEKSSAITPSLNQETREELQRQPQRIGEKQTAADCQANADNDGFLPFRFRRAERGDDETRECRNHQAQRADGDRKGKNRQRYE